MPGLDLYFAADTCFKKEALNKNPLIKFTRRFQQSIEYEKAVFGRSSSTEVFLLNNKQADDFKTSYQLKPDQMIIIPPGIDLDWNNCDQITIHDTFNIPFEDKVALFVGSDFSRKGLDRAISSVHYLNTNHIPFSLLVIGKDNFGPYSEMVDKLGLNEKIKFLGPRDDVASIMKSSDLLFHPAREEAAGNVIIEALVSNLPVATCKDVGFAEEVKKHKGGFVLEGDFDQDKFDNLVLEICENKELEKLKQGMRGLEKQEYFFSRFKFIADIVEERINE
jgi:UDP-glucose:(heptosyl)LPS alpha-1,3-glucosyltransferase